MIDKTPQAYQPSFFQALVCLFGIVFVVFLGLFVLQTSLHRIILVAIGWVMLHALYLDQHVSRLIHNISSAIRHAAPILLFFILIGAVIAAFTISGAIPTLIYLGLGFISTQAFLPIGMILCSMMSLAIGSCWGTVGTMGVALMGVAAVLNIPLPLAAGMVVSGAYFGDKFSPISDTTVLSALSAETNLYQHIKGMTYSMIPAYFITLGIFFFIGHHHVFETGHMDYDLTTIQQLIRMNVQVNILSLLPIVVMLTLSIKKKPATLSMLASIFVALGVAIWVQHMSVFDACKTLFMGPSMKATGSPIIDAVLSHGGIQNMLWPMASALLILTMGGLLEHYHFMTTLFAQIIRGIRRPITLVFSTMATSIACNILMGEAYLSIILTSRIYKKSYEKLNLENCVLSKSIEEGATFSTPLIPWTTSGVFIGATLGVSPVDYLFWSIFNWVAPIVFLVFVAVNFFGIKMYVQLEE